MIILSPIGAQHRMQNWFIRTLSSAIRLSISAVLFMPSAVATYTGTVRDANTGAPIADAVVTLGGLTTRTDHTGTFAIDGPGDAVSFRAYGYERRSLPASDFNSATQQVTLTPFKPKALYLSFFGIGSSRLREAAIGLIKKTELNALVIDVKGDRGMISYKSSIALAQQVGAQQTTTIRDPKGLLDRLHREHLYVIARIVVFKDTPLALGKPEFAVKDDKGRIFRDREDSAWTDPLNKEVWNYNIAVAVEAASLGFDEVQFDYLRFPDAPALVFSKPNTMANRLNAVTGFLIQARAQLTPYNVFLAADIFGYVAWNLDDTGIGQRLEDLSPVVDYISPMLYPSGFQFGIPGYPLPVANPYEVVFRSLQNARQRTGIAPIRFRPWLQAFRDYAFDRRTYRRGEIQTQIKAAEDFGTNGWMLWNSRNIYSVE